MALSNPVFTNAGKQLYLLASAGETITFTSIAVGEGETAPEDIATLTALKAPVKEMAITGKMQGTDHFMVTGSFRNDEIPHSFYWKEYGVFAADPEYPDDRTKDILVLYQSSGDNPEYISISSGEITEKTVRVNIFVGERSVTALVDSTVLVSKAELKEELANYTSSEKFSELSEAVSGLSISKADKTYVEEALKGKSDTDHTHDDRYYTETEADERFAAKSDIPTSLPADGGNSDTVDGLHAIDFSQIINYGNTSTDTKSAVGIEGKITAYWCNSWTDYPTGLPDGQGTILAINYRGSGTAGSDGIWARQVYISATSSFSNPRIYQRFIKATNVSDWKDIADGGNAATVGGAAVVTSAALGLHRLASGTDEATTTSCPVGCWYGKHS